jgi:RNA polymerase sporulation-specific sigma factor
MVTVQESEIERLVRENTGLIRSIVAKTVRSYPNLPGGYDRDDLESLGYIGLIQAAQTYDPERGAQFSTYAYRCIENQISSALARARNRQVDCISLSLLIGEDEDTPMEDQIFQKSSEYQDQALKLDAQTTVIDQASREVLEEAIARLPAPHDAIIRQMYFDGQSLTEVARALRLSPQRVQFLHSRALRMLRRHVRPLR